LYEKRGNHSDEGGNVLFQDSHVEWITPYSRIEELVAETKERLAGKGKQEADEL
jgi:prepilin-type processing-associated H-X9-DG protein